MTPDEMSELQEKCEQDTYRVLQNGLRKLEETAFGSSARLMATPKCHKMISAVMNHVRAALKELESLKP